MGKYGLFFILLHPLLIAYNYGENLLFYTFLPSLSSSFEKHVSYGRVALLLLLIIWLTSVFLRAQLGWRTWKLIHFSSYIVLPLAFLHVPRIGSSFDSEYIQLYWYSFIAIYLLCTALRLRYFFGFGKSTYSIVQIKKLNDSIYELTLQPLQSAIIPLPGQYVYIQNRLLGEEHPFSIADISPSGELAITLKTYGSFTRALVSSSIGTRLYLDGPYGTFTQEISTGSAREYVFLAGGIGITPFMQHLRRHHDKDRWLFYATNTRDDAVYSAELQMIKSLHYVHIYRDEIVNRAHSENGLLTREVLEKYLNRPYAYQFFICGPPLFIVTAKRILKELGVPEKNIHTEAFGF